jgi:hypothetical protein
MVCGSLKGTVVAILIWSFTAVQNQPSWSQKQPARNHSFPLFWELPSIPRISYAKPWNLLHISDSDFSSTFVQNPQTSDSDSSSNFSFDSPSLWFHLRYDFNLQIFFSDFTFKRFRFVLHHQPSSFDFVLWFHLGSTFSSNSFNLQLQSS